MPEPQTILITGASGLIGSALTKAFEADGHKVVRAVREQVQNPEQEIHWSPVLGEIDQQALEGVDAVVHLAGANIAGKRWTADYKRRILESRTQGTHLISDTIAKLECKPRVFLCASAIGYYGDRGSAELDESSAPGDDFLSEVCLQWERASQPAKDAGIRTVNTRIGVVLSPDGGALKSMLFPFKMGAGGVIGDGKQTMSWIALDDVVAAMQFLLTQDSISGPVNLVSPQPATNREFTKTLGKVLGRPTILPMPAFAARLAFGEMADALLLSSTRVVPERLLAGGFSFKYPQLDKALEHLLN
ncbi:TIGR01777 family oxidoreductase [Bythopirellula polymerisocia]|uniref:Epimerase family protein n=1 Tax=Bythopirellula polymerisocia TaxID=2528003 RepID=A0A5C6D3B0_9BACT|nr:TIGR01777 family oxidoreductase [Bythopirellula polymerisocia]TWU30137.1 Epimerase family protein [Bythopirellula polymerisocia]